MRTNCGTAVPPSSNLCAGIAHPEAAKRPEDELLLLPVQPRTERKRAGDNLRTWATILKEDPEPPSLDGKRPDEHFK